MTDITDKEQIIQVEKPWLFKPGESGNPAGRPKGTKNFDTLFDEAIQKILKEKKIDIDDPEIQIVVKAIIEALKGNFLYYRDIMDRRHGQPKKPIGLEVSIPQNLIDLFKYGNSATNTSVEGEDKE